MNAKYFAIRVVCHKSLCEGIRGFRGAKRTGFMLSLVIILCRTVS